VDAGNDPRQGKGEGSAQVVCIHGVVSDQLMNGVEELLVEADIIDVVVAHSFADPVVADFDLAHGIDLADGQGVHRLVEAPSRIIPDLADQEGSFGKAVRLQVSLGIDFRKFASEVPKLHASK